MGAVILFAGLASSTRSDPIALGPRDGGEFALEAAREFFGYVPSLDLRRKASGAERRLDRIRAWATRIREADSRGLPGVPALEPEPAEQAGVPAARGAAHPLTAGEAGRREAEFGLDMSLDMLRLDEQDKEPISLEGIPDVALLMADYLIDFADSAYYLAANLRKLLGQDPGIDLALLFRDRPHLYDQRSITRKAKGPAVLKRQAERTRNINVKKVVRSVFKILLGIAIGLILWLVVRHL